MGRHRNDNSSLRTTLMRRPVLLFVISLALALTLPGADWTLAQQPKRGGVVRIAEREAPGLDPHLSIRHRHAPALHVARQVAAAGNSRVSSLVDSATL